MGSIYRPKYMDRNGRERESAIWWIKYYVNGRPIRESTETPDHEDAKKLLKQKEGDATKGRPVKNMEHKVLYSELAALVEKDYELNRYRSAVDIELRHRLHILPFFGKMRASRITEADIDDYIFRRRDEEASNATINRELVTIKRAYSLGIQKKIVSDRPHISMLEEDNVRQGFFEREQLEDIKQHLQAHNQPPSEFAHITGWRKQEVLPLRWPQVDFNAETMRLGAGYNQESRGACVPFH